MARISNNEIATMMAQMTQMMAQMNARMDALESGKVSTTSSKKKSAPKSSSKKMVEFTKKDGTVVTCTEAQAKVWGAYRDREHMSLDEVKAISFNGKFTSAMDKWLVANPTCTCKEFKAQFKDARGCTKEQLKSHKAQMRANGKMK